MSDTPEKNAPALPIGNDDVMRFADGVLPPARRRAVRDAMAEDPALMQSFESFVFTRGPVARAFDAALAAPVPERLLRVVRETAPQRPRPEASRLGWASLARLVDLLRVSAFSPALAIPAVLVAAAGGWLAHYALSSDFVALEDRGFAASASLQRALEQTPGGTPAKLVEGLTFKPTLTFASVQQSWCRQFELEYGAALRDGGLACRTQEGTWRVLALTGPEPSAPRTSPDGIAPAGNIDILEETRAEIKRGDVLGREDVEHLIKEGWPTKP